MGWLSNLVGTKLNAFSIQKARFDASALTVNRTLTLPDVNVLIHGNHTGDVTSVGGVTTLTNAPVIAKVLTGFASGAGVLAATDSILAAIQKLNGNVSQTQVSDNSSGSASNITVPTWATRMSIYGIAGGGGGGSGRRGVSGTTGYGGGGGGGAGVQEYHGPCTAGDSIMWSSYAGGTAGASIGADTTNGNAGGIGDNLFVTWAGVNILFAAGGGAGSGGTTTSGIGGAGGFGGNGTGGTGASGTVAGAVPVAPVDAMGGGGGAAGAGFITGSAGGGGGMGGVHRQRLMGGTGGASSGGSGSAATAPTLIAGSAGGGGGGGGTGPLGGSGGAGIRGGGSGGGAASVNGFASGAGAVGSIGRVYIVFYP